MLEQAHSSALSGQTFNNATPVGGYGVYFEPCTTPPCLVQYFADANGNFTFDAPAEVIETFSLGPQITLDQIVPVSPVAVLYKPPRPFICFNDQCSGVNQITLSFSHRQSEQIRTLRINQVSGQVSY